MIIKSLSLAVIKDKVMTTIPQPTRQVKLTSETELFFYETERELTHLTIYTPENWGTSPQQYILDRTDNGNCGHSYSWYL